MGILRRRERTVGLFAYEVTLPGDVADDAVEARLDEGFLTVTLPKPEHERPRRIQVRDSTARPFLQGARPPRSWYEREYTMVHRGSPNRRAS